MNTIYIILMSLICVAVIVSLPTLVAIAVRIIFRNANKRILAMLTATPFALWLLLENNNFEITSDIEWEKYGVIFRLTGFAIMISANLLVNFGIPYVLAKTGVGIGDKIIKRNPNKRIEIDGENATHSPASHS